jgi:hypothetical protein
MKERKRKKKKKKKGPWCEVVMEKQRLGREIMIFF